MTGSHSPVRKRGSDRGDFGFARARDIAFDAVLELWRKRRDSGMKQSDIARILNRDAGWVSRQLRGPGNWTLRTLGELVEAMDGEVTIHAVPIEEEATERRNHDAYAGYRSFSPNLAAPVGAPGTIHGTASSQIPASVTWPSAARLPEVELT
jgi:hypothetical protein